MRGGGEGLHT